jgi:hypothetical protein
MTTEISDQQAVSCQDPEEPDLCRLDFLQASRRTLQGRLSATRYAGAVRSGAAEAEWKPDDGHWQVQGQQHFSLRRFVRCAHEAFLYESSVNRPTCEEQRDRLREELTLAELELSESQMEQFDIDSALAKAISVLTTLALSGSTRRSRVGCGFKKCSSRRASCGMAADFKPDCGLCPSATWPVEGSGTTADRLDRVQTPPISLASNELSNESQAGVDVGIPVRGFEPRSRG